MLTKCKFQSGVGGFRAADSRMNVMSYRTLTLFEIRPDNLQVTVNAKCSKTYNDIEKLKNKLL